LRARIASLAWFHPKSWSTTMKNPLDTLTGTVVSGLVLTVVLYFLARAMMGA